jgi:hypothetical protein
VQVSRWSGRLCQGVLRRTWTLRPRQPKSCDQGCRLFVRGRGHTTHRRIALWNLEPSSARRALALPARKFVRHPEPLAAGAG